MKLAVVTATINLERATPCIASWWKHDRVMPEAYVVLQGGKDRAPAGWSRVYPQDHIQFYYSEAILGVVPAFALGVQKALDDGADLIACFHDDLEIEEPGWDQTVLNLFRACPRAGLCGFGGARGLGSDDLYQTPYNPMQLARQGFLSNMRHAEAHGTRMELACPVACLDGFSQIGIARFWRGIGRTNGLQIDTVAHPRTNLFQAMTDQGVRHHWYDGALGAYAKRLGYQVWMLPIRVHHFGGRTAVGDTRYHQWADAQRTDPGAGTGDQQFWEQAHRWGYDEFRDCLPIRT